MANERPTVYVGMTNNILKRIWQHKYETKKSFVAKYRLRKLVYYEYCHSIEEAIVREKQIKDMNRTEKLKMISRFNPQYKDLYQELLKNNV